jgi:hypothetical protein
MPLFADISTGRHYADAYAISAFLRSRRHAAFHFAAISLSLLFSHRWFCCCLCRFSAFQRRALLPPITADIFTADARLFSDFHY